MGQVAAVCVSKCVTRSVCTCNVHVHLYMCTCVHYNYCTIYAEIFVGEIFRRLNFCGWSHPRKFAAINILPPWQLAQWKYGYWVQKKSYACVDTTFTTTYGKLLLKKHWFAWESQGTLMTQWQSKKSLATCPNFLGGKIFVGLIFMVEGTHENFNTKISAYTVYIYIYTCTLYCTCKIISICYNTSRRDYKP